MKNAQAQQQLRPAHEVLVSEIKRVYEAHSTFSDRVAHHQAENKGVEPPFKLLVWLTEQEDCAVVLSVLCSVLEQMIIPSAHLNEVVTDLTTLRDSALYESQPEYCEKLREIIYPTIASLQSRPVTR